MLTPSTAPDSICWELLPCGSPCDQETDYAEAHLKLSELGFAEAESAGLKNDRRMMMVALLSLCFLNLE
ncbi:hypothetical protein Nepgr_002754 [Nepenthes gracilis]|uniref:Uncharacterized protein n=1 Tax=Nepenthes gracilis TaxID=150966 RepID=A0AAD3P491_NEPGR|nr:hypothetical protein Nepgr_002754 [Nepenthes gracilis]